MIKSTHVKEAVSQESRFYRVALLVIVFWWLLVSLGPQLENIIYPVVRTDTTKIELMEQDEEGGFWNVVFSVERPFRFVFTCTRTGSTWYREMYNGWQAVSDGDVTVMGRLPSSRPIGTNISPINTFRINGKYLLRVTYDCGLPWQSYGWMGPIMVGNTTVRLKS